MVRSTLWKLALIAVGAFTGLASPAGRSFADDSEGVVRICSQVPGQAASGGSCQPGGACQSGQSCRSNGGIGGRNCGVYGYHGNGNCGYYGYGCMRPCGHVHQFLDWFNPHGMCTHSPDHGYAPPGKLHTPHPQQVAYQKGFPDAWTGQAGAGMGVGGPRAVAIYMPTDTTQLGYYYQAVPRWQAYRGMIPPTPIPSQWHRELCQGQGHAHTGHGEQIIHERAIEAQPLPAEPNLAPEAAPQPNPVQPAPVAPAPPAEPAPAAAPLEKAANPNLQPIN